MVHELRGRARVEGAVERADSASCRRCCIARHPRARPAPHHDVPPALHGGRPLQVCQRQPRPPHRDGVVCSGRRALCRCRSVAGIRTAVARRGRRPRCQHSQRGCARCRVAVQAGPRARRPPAAPRGADSNVLAHGGRSTTWPSTCSIWCGGQSTLKSPRLPRGASWATSWARPRCDERPRLRSALFRAARAFRAAHAATAAAPEPMRSAPRRIAWPDGTLVERGRICAPWRVRWPGGSVRDGAQAGVHAPGMDTMYVHYTVYVCTCGCVRAHVHVCACVCMCVCMCTYMHAYIHTYVHT